VRSKDLKEIIHEQLKEIAEIVMPNIEFDFAKLRQEIKKLKSESILSQLKVKKIEQEEHLETKIEVPPKS